MRPDWAEYERAVASLYTPISAGDGVSEDELHSVEERLALRLPAVLRDLYLLTGMRGDIHRAWESLLEPDELAVDTGALVSYTENQSVTVWGVELVALKENNPPVVHLDDEYEPIWRPDHDTLYGFLLTMLYWNATNGGLGYLNAVSDVDETTLSSLRRNWPQIELGRHHWPLQVYSRKGQVLCLSTDVEAPVLHIAGRTLLDYQEITKLLGHDSVSPDAYRLGNSPANYPQAVRGRQPSGREALLEAVRRGHHARVKRLISDGVDSEAKDAALVSAVINKHEDIVSLLLANGANPNARDNTFNRTPLVYAEDRRAGRRIIEALKAAGANE